MKNMNTLGMVGGGQMGEALIRGFIETALLEVDKIMVMEPDPTRRDYLRTTYGVGVADAPEDVARFSSAIILAVKPQVMEAVAAQYKKVILPQHLLISIAAGITLERLEAGFGNNMRIVRVMPNTPALVLAGASALSGNRNVERADMDYAMRLFSAVGSCVELSENLLDAVTGLSGSGPGYVFTFIEAMIDGGVLAGIPRPIAEKLVLQTVYGSAKMAQQTGEHPALLKGRVTSPGGTTIAGLHVLEESGMRGAVMSAIAAATERSRELGQ